jgi:ParB-like chromosome segregation protein Spo0J
MAGETGTTPSEIAGFGLLDRMSEGLPEKEYHVEDIIDDTFQFKPLTIDPEFKNLIPPLTNGEYEALKETISTEGCRDPLTIWKGKGIILDGHHRYEICEELKIPFKTVEYEFPDRTGAEIWMIKNQRIHRHLEISQRVMQAVKLEALYGEQAKERQGTRTDLGKKLDQSEKGRSAEKAAKDMGVSPQTVASAMRVVKKGIPALIKMMESGEAKVSVAAKVASYSADVQEKIVAKALNQIQEGKKPKIAAIIREMNPVKEEVQKDDAAISECANEEKDEPINNQESVPEESNVCAGESCDPWAGPWVCTHCNAWWKQMDVPHAPKHCPGCDETDGIKRRDLVDWELRPKE